MKLTHSQAVNRLHEIEAELSRIGAKDRPSRSENVRAAALGLEIDEVGEHIRTLQRAEDLAHGKGNVRIEGGSIGRGGGVDDAHRTLATGGDGRADARSASAAWARNTADTLRRNLGGGEQRAVISGSIDIPTLVMPQVVDIPHPVRLIDLLVNRVGTESMAYEYYRQTARTNNAAPVVDLATKPVSVLTVEAIQDRCRVMAHLSEPVPYRIWFDDEAIVRWLTDEMTQGVLDALEHQALSGDGTGENMTGVLHTTGTTAVAFATDVPTTLRSAVTALQNLGEVPTGWALNPADAQAIDLLRWGTGGGLLTGGFEDSNAQAIFGSADNILGADVKRVISPTVPAGTAILADWTKLKLFVHWDMMVMANAFGDSLFTKNAVQLRAEMLVGVGVLRPQAFAVVDLTA
jgi:HK97 family phage major capsid protein